MLFKRHVVILQSKEGSGKPRTMLSALARAWVSVIAIGAALLAAWDISSTFDSSPASTTRTDGIKRNAKSGQVWPTNVHEGAFERQGRFSGSDHGKPLGRFAYRSGNFFRSQKQLCARSVLCATDYTDEE